VGGRTRCSPIASVSSDGNIGTRVILQDLLLSVFATVG
jgi:hypothetical protein